jgi:hypothetical protein
LRPADTTSREAASPRAPIRHPAGMVFLPYISLNEISFHHF